MLVTSLAVILICMHNYIVQSKFALVNNVENSFLENEILIKVAPQESRDMLCALLVRLYHLYPPSLEYRSTPKPESKSRPLKLQPSGYRSTKMLIGHV